MSTDVSLHIQVVPRRGGAVTSARIITSLIEAGWTISRNGTILYLPLGDKDNFYWQEGPISTADFLGLAQKKEQAEEVVGVVLVWGDTRVGGELLIHPDHLVSLCITSERRKLFDNVTDVNWYLERMLPCLATDSMMVEYFRFTQF